jgi:hypothetical protein
MQPLQERNLPIQILTGSPADPRHSSSTVKLQFADLIYRAPAEAMPKSDSSPGIEVSPGIVTVRCHLARLLGCAPTSGWS